MNRPVSRTSKRTIWPVCIEVITLNLIFGIALNALPGPAQQTIPDYQRYEIAAGVPPEAVPEAVKEYRDTAMRMLAEHTGGVAFGAQFGQVLGVAAGIIFGLLLLSAVNTAVMAMVSVMFSMSSDRELPRPLMRLNYSGVPWIPLVLACAAPALVLIFETDVKALGELYAIGVVGAITINVLSCAYNRELPISVWERRGMWALGVLMALIEVTIIFAKPNATVFAATLVGIVLAARYATTAARRRVAAQPPIEMPETGWLAELERQPTEIAPGKPRIMLAARGQAQAEFAVDLARRRGAVLFAIYVRTLRLIDPPPGSVPHVRNDERAMESLGTVAVLARRYGVPFVPIYVTSSDIAEEILDYTVTFGCDTLILGKSRRWRFSRAVEGDVIAKVAANLPSEVALITRDATPHPLPPPPSSPGVDEQTARANSTSHGRDGGK